MLDFTPKAFDLVRELVAMLPAPPTLAEAEALADDLGLGTVEELRDLVVEAHERLGLLLIVHESDGLVDAVGVLAPQREMARQIAVEYLHDLRAA